MFAGRPLYSIYFFKFLLLVTMGSLLVGYFYLVIFYWPYFRTIEIFSANETKYLFIYLIATFLTYAVEVGCYAAYANVASYVIGKMSEEELLGHSQKRQGTIMRVKLTRSGDFILYLRKTGRKITAVKLSGTYDMLPELYSKLNINQVLGVEGSWHPETELARLLLAFVIKNNQIPAASLTAFAVAEHIVAFSMEYSCSESVCIHNT